MNRSSNKKFQVFEFDNDDDGVERYNHNFRDRLGLQRTKKKREDDSPISKYHFLQSFTHHTEIRGQGKGETIDVDAKGIEKTKKARDENVTEILHIDDDGKDELVDVEMTTTSSKEKIPPTENVSPEIRVSEAILSATLTLCTPKNQVLREKHLNDPDCGGCEINDENMTVTIYSGFVVYRDISLGESFITFSCNGIKLEGSTLNGTRKKLFSEWTTRDVRKIESNWNSSVETAMVCLDLRSKKFKKSGTANKSSGVEKLIFQVYEPDWFKAQAAIKNLNKVYKDKWNCIEIDLVSTEKELWSGSSAHSPQKYFSSSDKPFRDVIYPEGDPDAVIIHKGDIELLEPERFINDTIIDFYIKYLARNFQSDEKHKFHFFNSFFFRKLVDLDKDRSEAYEGVAAYQRVSKWTRKVDIFRKKYIFIPVNYSFHWSLLVVCHPGEVPNSVVEESESVSKVPCILHMDSIRGSHKGLKNLIQSYLCEEWKERHIDAAKDASSKFLHMKFISLELPQQENFFDCGLFLLYYVERFLEEAPLSFCPFTVTKSSNFLSKNWFLPKEASLKRQKIKKLIYKIFDDPSRNMPKADSIDQDPSTWPRETCDQETEAVVLERISGHEVRGSLTEPRGDLCIGKSGLVSSDLSEPGPSSSSYTGANYQQSPAPGDTTLQFKEVEDIDEKVPETPLDVYSFLDSPLRTDEEVSDSLLIVEDSVEERVEDQSTEQHEVSGFIRKHEKQQQEIRQFGKDKVTCVISNLDKELADCIVKDSDGEDSDNDGSNDRCFLFSKGVFRKRSS